MSGISAHLGVLALCVFLCVCVVDGQHLPRMTVNSDDITVSGISSGGAFAVQFHVSYSATIRGMAALAAPPYYCALGNAITAQSSCMVTPGLMNVDQLVAAAVYAESLLSIDALSNLKQPQQRVWLESGTKDSVVVPGVVVKTVMFYKRLMDGVTEHVRFVNDIPAEHAWLTDDFGNACAYKGDPFINNCDYDAAGQFLQYFSNSTLNRRVSAVPDRVFKFSQGPYLPVGVVSPRLLSLADEGYYYLPEACEAATCAVHVVFHGCKQGPDTIGQQLVLNAGVNEWAEANRIIVLYPQAVKSPVVPYNPNGCWDWWGYTAPSYASQLGPQMITIKNMLVGLGVSFK